MRLHLGLTTFYLHQRLYHLLFLQIIFLILVQRLLSPFHPMSALNRNEATLDPLITGAVSLLGVDCLKSLFSCTCLLLFAMVLSFDLVHQLILISFSF